LHIINQLSSESPNNLIKYQHLIIYSHSSSLPSTVLQGEEFEPIMFNIIYGFSDRNPSDKHLQTVRHISKNTTIAELKELLYFEYFNEINPDRLKQTRLLKLNLQEKNTRKSKKEYKFDEENQTIEQLHLQDGDTLGIEEKTAL